MRTDELKTEPTLGDVMARLDSLSARVDSLVERQRKTEELFTEFTPILKEVMATATTTLADLEKKGYFAFGKELVRVGQRVVEGFSADDVRRLGDSVVEILGTVRSLTQPEVLAIAGDASEVLANADRAEPLGLLGMVRASRSDDVQRGMAVMLEVLRHVGRGAGALAKGRGAQDDARAKLARRLGRSRALGIERRLASPAVSAPHNAAVPAPTRASCAVPKPPGPTAVVIDGVGFAADGHLSDPSVWTKQLGETIAAAQGVQLTEAHWKLVDFAREEFLATKASPNIRRITLATGVSTKDVYALFPKAPARTVARIAGIPKPVGCL